MAMKLFYKLVGQTPVPIEVSELHNEAELGNHIVRQTQVGRYEVSTVFLFINHDFNHTGVPKLFETMSWINSPGAADDGEYVAGTDRCSTWLEAEIQHARRIAELKQPGDIVEELREDPLTKQIMASYNSSPLEKMDT